MSTNIQQVSCHLLILLMTTQARKCIGAIGSTSSAEKVTLVVTPKWFVNALPSPWGICRVSRPHGPQREVRSLFTLISHALGQNNKHSSSLHMLMHSQMKNRVQVIILHETCVLDCFYIYAITTHHPLYVYTSSYNEFIAIQSKIGAL